MANSLLTGVSGLASHQHMIEVVGNNLANLNTVGFKTGRAHFSDVFYETVKAGGGGGVGAVSGSNATQIGNGSKLASVGIDFGQGILETTASRFDFAIDGDGFFQVNSGRGPLYTRAGVFNLDNNGFLVDSSTGFHVQRFGNVGEAGGNLPAFQSAGNNSINIPLGATVPGNATTEATVSGNLSAAALGSLPQIIESATALQASGSPATGATLINDLDIVSSPFSSPDVLNVQGTAADGSAVNFQFAITGTTTVNDLVSAIDGAYADADVSLTADGEIQVTAQDSGISLLSLNLSEDAGNSGAIDLSAFNFLTTQQGKNGDIVRGAVEVFDERGDGHLVTLSFQKETNGTWTMTADIDAAEGTIPNSTISGITFAADGSISGVTGPDSQLVFQFNGQPDPQAVQFGFGASGTLSGLTSIPGESSVASVQDGFSTGTLVDINVEGNGLIEGVGSNGLRFPIAQMALATFKNPHGLTQQGNNFFSDSIASGEAQVGQPGTSGRGRIASGQLENSNVDIAVEFTRLILAQRGFSANARTITVTDEVLEELNSLIR